jgi:drug/metabolite transporter (DMT)-like permease
VSAVLVLYLYQLILCGFPTVSAGVQSVYILLVPMHQAGVAALLLGEGMHPLLQLAVPRECFCMEREQAFMHT